MIVDFGPFIEHNHALLTVDHDFVLLLHYLIVRASEAYKPQASVHTVKSYFKMRRTVAHVLVEFDRFNQPLLDLLLPGHHLVLRFDLIYHRLQVRLYFSDNSDFLLLLLVFSLLITSACRLLSNGRVKTTYDALLLFRQKRGARALTTALFGRSV